MVNTKDYSCPVCGCPGGPMSFSKKKEAHANMDLLMKGDVGLLGTQRYGGSRLTSYAPERLSVNADKMEGTNE